MKYIWEQEIVNIVGNMVEFKDWIQEYYTDTQLWYLVTDEPKDLTQIRDIMLDNIIPDIMEIIEEHNIRKWDLQAIIQSIVWTYNNLFLTEVWKRFGTFRKWLHPEYFIENIRPSDMKIKDTLV